MTRRGFFKMLAALVCVPKTAAVSTNDHLWRLCQQNGAFWKMGPWMLNESNVTVASVWGQEPAASTVTYTPISDSDRLHVYEQSTICRRAEERGSAYCSPNEERYV